MHDSGSSTIKSPEKEKQIIFKRTSGREPSCEPAGPRARNVSQVPNSVIHFTLSPSMFLGMFVKFVPSDVLGNVCHRFCLLSHVHLFMHCAGFVETVNEPGKISIKSAKNRQPHIFPFPNWKRAFGRDLVFVWVSQHLRFRQVINPSCEYKLGHKV